MRVLRLLKEKMDSRDKYMNISFHCKIIAKKSDNFHGENHYLCFMFVSMIEILAELGRRLGDNCESAAHGGGLPDSVMECAVAGNPWFTAVDVRRAARNIASDMLSREALSKWLSRYPALPVPDPKNVLIIMAGNIPFVGMQDLICVLAAGHRAIVKPSSKDSVLMSWVVSQLLDIAPGVPVTIIRELSIISDAVIAMGGNEAVAAIREKYAGVPMLLRGNRSSLAVLDGTESAVELAALADDVLSYSGLGCRNVSLLFVPRGYDFAKLQNALSQREMALNLKYRNNYCQARAMLRMNGTPHIDAGSCLLIEEKDFPANISVVNYVFYDTLHEVKDWVDGHTAEIQYIATNINNYQLSIINYQLGQAQHPSIADYPDRRDTMKFLLSLSENSKKPSRYVDDI